MASAGVLLAACRKDESAITGATGALASTPPASADAAKKAEPPETDGEVSAVEDLMREHGVIRRVLIVYRESAVRLRTKAPVPAEALQKAARLMRNFGEDYHERQLEEAHLFPALKKAGGPAAAEIDTLLAQHQRGREITDYVLAVTAKAVAAANVEPLARTLEAFARMYEAHTAREDTIVFQAWKQTMSPKQLDEMGDLFEDIEKKTFGKDGFDDAVDQVSAIEKVLGIELAAMTAPPAPKAS